jgi:hypothetical protein
VHHHLTGFRNQGRQYLTGVHGGFQAVVKKGYDSLFHCVLNTGELGFAILGKVNLGFASSFEGVFNPLNVLRIALYSKDIEAAGTVQFVLLQIAVGSGEQFLLLANIYTGSGPAETVVAAEAHLHKHYSIAFTGDKVYLSVATSVISFDQGESGTL